jgi:hypothetical protein
MTGQWGPFVLDRLIAPKCSELTACLAPELPEPYNYFGTFFLNNVLIFDFPDNTRSLTIAFLRRLKNATQAYRDGRDQMLRCVAALRHSNEMVRAYLDSLSHFESAIVNAYLALLAHDAVAKLIDPVAPRSFNKNDNSPAQRLNAAYNALKHFDENVQCGYITKEFTTPLWLVDDGIQCVGSEGAATLRFEELTEILRDLERDAKFLAEDVFRMAREKTGKTTQT